MKCQCCRRRRAVWRTGSDGFSAKKNARVCDDWTCRTWASGGYPVTFYAIKK